VGEAFSVTYPSAFKAIPALGITITDMAAGDNWVITSEARTGFTIHFKNQAGTSVARTFNYTAVGYGAEA
jgi:hypothetical protein